MVPRHFTTLCVEGLNWRMGEQESLRPGGKAYEQISIPLYLLEHNFTENSRRKNNWQSQPGNEKQAPKKGGVEVANTNTFPVTTEWSSRNMAWSCFKKKNPNKKISRKFAEEQNNLIHS